MNWPVCGVSLLALGGVAAAATVPRLLSLPAALLSSPSSSLALLSVLLAHGSGPGAIVEFIDRRNGAPAFG
jgi:hypothetical protein